MVATKTENLLQIKTMKASHAKQVKVLEYDWNDGSTFKMIWLEFKRQIAAGTSEGGNAVPCGWIMQETIDPKASSLRKLWLVRYRGEYFWWASPSAGSEIDVFFSDSMIDQLFI